MSVSWNQRMNSSHETYPGDPSVASMSRIPGNREDRHWMLEGCGSWSLSDDSGLIESLHCNYRPDRGIV